MTEDASDTKTVEDENGKTSMPYIGKRKLIKVGDSVYLSVPKEFMEGNNLSVGDEVLVLANTDMLVSKKNAENVEKAHKKIEELIKEGNHS